MEWAIGQRRKCIIDSPSAPRCSGRPWPSVFPGLSRFGCGSSVVEAKALVGYNKWAVSRFKVTHFLRRTFLDVCWVGHESLGFSQDGQLSRESDGSSKLAHNAVGLWKSRKYRGKKKYLYELSLGLWMLLTLIPEWETVRGKRLGWYVKNKLATH